MNSDSSSQGKHVLVVDDDPGVHAVLRMALEDEGYAVQAAHDGAEAIDCLRQGQFDVVLLDLMMANVSGWKFLELYRQSPGPLTPVIVLSALQRNALKLPTELIAAVLAKPFSVDHLLQTIRRVVGG